MIRSTLQVLDNISFKEASNGLEAIEYLTISSIDLMTLDLNMPDIQGLDVLKFINSHQSLNKTPIIVISARSDAQTRDEVMAAGATHFMNKPFEPKQLMAQVVRLLDTQPDA
jgi:two-component system chemotaxis response regulator CheY